MLACMMAIYALCTFMINSFHMYYANPASAASARKEESFFSSRLAGLSNSNTCYIPVSASFSNALLNAYLSSVKHKDPVVVNDRV